MADRKRAKRARAAFIAALAAWVANGAHADHHPHAHGSDYHNALNEPMKRADAGRFAPKREREEDHG